MKVVGSSLVPVNLVALLPKPWHELIDIEHLVDISKKLTDDFIPSSDSIFRCLELEPSEIKVVILGQDPYPNPSHAMGLAFSVNCSIKPLPASLNNIFKELDSDLGIKRNNGDLSDWSSQGVLLLNRSLTVIPNLSDSHSDIGWHKFTEEVIRVVAARGAIGVLWGKQAQDLGKLFNQLDQFSSPHPSPLSAYRGFFGSKPFSKVNNRLLEKGLTPIKW
jgi:uracil-DNA glycosylase